MGDGARPSPLTIDFLAVQHACRKGTPITNVARFERFGSLPPELVACLEPIREDAGAVVATGIEWAIDQRIEMLEGGAPGPHFDTLSRSAATRSILADVLRRP